MVEYKVGLSKRTGAMGPKATAFWPKINGTTGAIYSMEATPLIYNTTTGIYDTAYDANAAKVALRLKNLATEKDVVVLKNAVPKDVVPENSVKNGKILRVNKEKR